MDRIEVKFAADEVDAKTGEFAGYASVFGNVDSHGDVIPPGAFAETLGEWAQRGRLPAMKLMHGTAINPFTGDDLPIGKWLEMREDGRGLFAKGRLSGLDTDHGRRIHGLMRDGILDGLSIGYKAKRFTRLSGPAKRQLDAVSLFEVSLVDDPSNDRARLTSVKSAETIKTIREFEDFLRDVGGYSHAAAKSIAAGGFKAAEPRDEDDADDIVARLRRNIATLVPKG
jgi:HK97 family phage prohead protease